jgi:hypothetical protein
VFNGNGMVNSSNDKPPTNLSMFNNFMPKGDEKKEEKSSESDKPVTVGVLPQMQQLSKLPVLGDESIMSEKEHGTTKSPVQKDLRYECDFSTADRICCYNRHYAEHSGYAFESPRTWLD